MKNLVKYLSFLLAIILLVSCNKKPLTKAETLLAEIDSTAPANSLAEKEKSAGWQLLFDGSTFTNWHGYNMDSIPGCWIIEDNAITMTTEGRGESQDILTDKEYTKFALSAEFKLTKGANSGIIFQVSEDTMYHYPYVTGPEYQVIDHKNWPDPLENWQTCGANYAMYPPLSDPSRPLGEWNHACIVVDGNHVTQFLNGVKVVEYEKYSEEWKKLRASGKWVDYPDYGKFDTGHIDLQNHGTKVWYRNIKIKELQ
jgi:hypothetical protein